MRIEQEANLKIILQQKAELSAQEKLEAEIENIRLEEERLEREAEEEAAQYGLDRIESARIGRQERREVEEAERRLE